MMHIKSINKQYATETLQNFRRDNVVKRKSNDEIKYWNYWE